MSLSDRRRFPRFPFHSRGELRMGGAWRKGTLVDISLRGALFSLESTPPESEAKLCALRVFQPCGSQMVLLSGLVVHSGENLIGLKFINLGEAEKAALEQIIDLNLALPRLLERDIPALLRA